MQQTLINKKILSNMGIDDYFFKIIKYSISAPKSVS